MILVGHGQPPICPQIIKDLILKLRILPMEIVFFLLREDIGYLMNKKC